MVEKTGNKTVKTGEGESIQATDLSFPMEGENQGEGEREGERGPGDSLRRRKREGAEMEVNKAVDLSDGHFWDAGQRKKYRRKEV